MKKGRISKKTSMGYSHAQIDKSYLILISIFFILIIIKLIMSSAMYMPFYMPDELAYFQQAQHLFEGHMELINPGYPIILSLAFAITNDFSFSYHVMLFISAIISTSIIFPAYFILRKYCPNNISILGALTVTTLTSINFFSITLLTENLFTPLFLFSVWFLINSYTTDDIKWQIFAALSVVYLYVTRSDGIAMLVGFAAAFIYYMLINRKKSTMIGLALKKIVLLATFVIALVLWLQISHMANTNITYGSTYDVIAISGHSADTFSSVQNLLKSIKLFANETVYLIISSFFLLTAIIFYYITKYKNKRNDSPLIIVNVYTVISLFILLLAFVVFSYYSGEGFDIFGRYVEPIIPMIIIMGIISIYDMKKMDKKYMYYFLIFFIAILAISIFIMETNLSIINAFVLGEDNPGIYYLEPLYHISYPEIFVYIYALAFLLLIYLSIKNKAYINVLLILIILSSMIPTYSLYNKGLESSILRKDNDINHYLIDNSNKKTQLYIDTNMSHEQQTAGMDVYSFWNKGSTGYMNGDNKELISNINNNVYIITVRQLPYREVADDYIFKLYQVT